MATPDLPPQPKHFTRTIAERAFTQRNADGVLPIRYEFGEPIRDVPCIDGFDWRCPVRITTGSESVVRSAFGVDSLQCLQLAFVMARAELRLLASRRGTMLLWEDEPVDPMAPL